MDVIKIKKILVPTDFSENSLKAIRHAVAFAKTFKASVTLLHVVEIHFGGAIYGPLDFPMLEKDFVDSSDKQLTELAEKTASTEGITVDKVTKSGHTIVEIVDYARENAVDLIIISTHGHTGLAHVLLGSTAENIVRHAPCPVLVVRENAKEIIKT